MHPTRWSLPVMMLAHMQPEGSHFEALEASIGGKMRELEQQALQSICSLQTASWAMSSRTEQCNDIHRGVVFSIYYNQLTFFHTR